MTVERLLLKPEEAAEMLGICRSKLYKLLADGRLPSVAIGGARRISTHALRKWVDELENAPGRRITSIRSGRSASPETSQGDFSSGKATHSRLILDSL